MLRIWRAYNEEVCECTSFVIPNTDDACAVKVTIKFEGFKFQYCLDYVPKIMVSTAIYNMVSHWPHIITVDPPSSYFIRLSQAECDSVDQGALQVESSSTLNLRNRSNTRYWKFNRAASSHFFQLASVNIDRAIVVRPSRLECSLLPIGQEVHGELQFYRFDL